MSPMPSRVRLHSDPCPPSHSHALDPDGGICLYEARKKANATREVLLNLKWAKTQGPRGIEEEGVLAVMILGGVVEGWRSLRNEEWLPLVAFWGIPVLSLAGTIVEK